jgi:hypothetical protein
MDIKLNQAEIIEAIEQYVGKQGISLANKHLGVVFTAGRKESGLSADLTITDAEIPGFTSAAPVAIATASVATVETEAAKATPVAEAQVGATAASAAVVEADPAAETEVPAVAEAEVETAGAEEVKPATTSLFG